MSSETLLDNERELDPRADRPRPSSTLPRRIFIDCTPTFRRNCGTGIQRVVYNIVNYAPTAHEALGIECQGLAYTSQQGFAAVNQMRSRSHVEEAAPGAAAAAVLATTSKLRAPLRILKRSARHALTALQLIDVARTAKANLRIQLKTAQRKLTRTPESGVLPGKGDVLLLTDTIWDTPEVWDGVRRAASRGAMIGAIVYDLIPLRYPELYGPYVAKIFKDWITKVAHYSDFLVCISQSVWEDTQEYLQKHQIRNRRGQPLRGGYFRLGVGLDVPSEPVDVRVDLTRLYANHASGNPYLVVGSFDPRKDLGTVVRAFEKLWAGGSQTKLVTIGRRFTGSSPLELLVAEHPERGRRLFAFQDVEDAELDYCYRRSASLITASYAEGFNLPIVESLQRGRPVLAGDIPVHREVAGDFAHYFPCQQPDKLAELITQQQQGALPGGLDQVRDFRWPEWSASCQELYGKIASLYDGASYQRQAA